MPAPPVRHLIGPLALSLCLACQRPAAPPEPPAAPAEHEAAAVTVNKDALPLFAPLPTTFDLPGAASTPAMVALGQQLYHDPRLSRNHDVSCNSCHDLARYGVDGARVSPGHRRQLGKRNSPSVYNAAGHLAQFWDGRSANVEHQATQPLLNPGEMATDARHLAALINSIPDYVRAFRAAFPDDKTAVSLENTGRAIGAFERQLVTPSRWDKFLGGDAAALSDGEKRGFNTFVATGCATCHNGALVGAQLYQKAGLVKPWPTQTDAGRFEVTHVEADRGVFKVPSLRNVARTAPYFHDGEVADLAAAVRRMAEFQLGRTLGAGEVDDIVAWLGALTGDLPVQWLAKPQLPAGSAKTPKPDPT